MRNYTKLIYWIVGILTCIASSEVYSRQVIEISSQSRFDSLTSIITHQLEMGEKDIYIKLAAQKFKYSENHLHLKGIAYPKSSVTISGEEGTVIFSDGMGYSRGDAYRYGFNHHNTFLDDQLQELPIWSESMIANDTIRIIDPSVKRCFIPYRGHLQSIRDY